MVCALCALGGCVVGVAVVLFFAAVVADDVYPPTRTEIGRQWRR